MADKKEETEQTVRAGGWKAALANRFRLIVLAIIVILAVVALLVYRQAQLNKSAFVIDHKAYSKQLIMSIAQFAIKGRPQTKQQAAKSIFELYKTQIASQKANIVPTSAEIQAQYNKWPKPKTEAERQYITLVSYNIALGDAYGRYMSGEDKGSTFIFNFSRYVLPPAAQEKPLPGHGDSTLISQDKAYAYQQAQSGYRAYKAGKISAAALLTKIASDPKLTQNNSNGSFDASIGDLQGQIYYQNIYSYIANQDKPGISVIKTGKVPTKLSPGPNDYADGYYYFVDLQKATRLVSDPAGAVNKQLKKLQAAYYGI